MYLKRKKVALSKSSSNWTSEMEEKSILTSTLVDPPISGEMQVFSLSLDAIIWRLFLIMRPSNDNGSSKTPIASQLDLENHIVTVDAQVDVRATEIETQFRTVPWRPSRASPASANRRRRLHSTAPNFTSNFLRPPQKSAIKRHSCLRRPRTIISGT
ncbi:hypothetical protein SCHPADRAFT_48645 [Schizopora paradoxa]|uniref:Uncharacterized protein n=1 Tax=Schizopora paradoxa TaxID=27342 RepID=A0A0H2S5U3_9AGAM|nr:hypothetical protein SCHPADRAFT_48645 [Schizopora paradoxa]